MQSVLTEEGSRKFISLMNMEWKDFDHLMKRYDSKINEDNFAKRVWLWACWNMLGYQYKCGLIDIETLYNACGDWIILSWLKFQPIIYGLRDNGDFSSETLKYFEYLAMVVSRTREQRDPSYKGSR